MDVCSRLAVPLLSNDEASRALLARLGGPGVFRSILLAAVNLHGK
jgi:hypothetical protein